MFPWGSVLLQLLWALLYTLVAWIVITLILSLTVRRSLTGGILEAQVKLWFYNNGWFFPAAVAGLAIGVFIQGQVVGGIILLLAALVLVLPKVWFFNDLSEEAVKERLAEHIYSKREEINRQQSAAQQNTTAKIEINAEKPFNTAALSAEEQQQWEKILLRFRGDRLLRSINHDAPENLVNDAISSLNNSSSFMNPGSNASMMAVFSEFIVLYLLSLGGAFLALGVRSTVGVN